LREQRRSRPRTAPATPFIENSLIVLSGLQQDEVAAIFEGRNSPIHASLVSWINDGSHNAHDDIYVAVDDDSVQG